MIADQEFISKDIMKSHFDCLLNSKFAPSNKIDKILLGDAKLNGFRVLHLNQNHMLTPWCPAGKVYVICMQETQLTPSKKLLHIWSSIFPSFGCFPFIPSWSELDDPE